MEREIISALAPVSWPASLVRNGEHGYGIASNLVKDGLGEVAKNMSPDRVFVFRPHQRIGGELIDGFERPGSKGVGGNGAAPARRAGTMNGSARGSGTARLRRGEHA